MESILGLTFFSTFTRMTCPIPRHGCVRRETPHAAGEAVGLEFTYSNQAELIYLLNRLERLEANGRSLYSWE